MVLYKYYGYISGMAALKSRKLGFRIPKYFNDPFELSYFDISGGSGFVSDKTATLRDSLVILSLTKTPYNPLMWAHYADDHRGFVIGYDIEDEFFLSKKYNLISVDKGDVRYRKNKKKVDITDELKGALNSISLLGQGGGLESIPKGERARIYAIFKNILLNKHLCWKYEEEVRVVRVLDSIFDESHEWQSDPNRAFSLLDKLVAPGIGIIAIPGLYLFDKEVNILEVYLGMRNPLLSQQNGDSIMDKSVCELAKNLAWSVNKIAMTCDSWDLDSTAIATEYLNVPYKIKGLVNNLSFSGREAGFLSGVLPNLLASDDDSYELTNWSGDLKLKKNGKFVA